MRRAIASTIVLATLSMLGGCSVAYSSIRKQDDGTYLLTGSKAKAFKLQATLYRCTASGATLDCQVVALPKRK
jgi:hypothetical protein